MASAIGAAALIFLTCANVGAQSKKKATPAPSPTPAKSRTGDLSESLGVESAAQLPDIVATVNGEAIHRDELERTLQGLLAANGRDPGQLNNDERAKAYHSVLEEIIADRLVAHESANEKVSEIDVEKRFDEAKRGFPTQDAFEAELKKSGRTVEQVKGAIRGQLRQQQWLQNKVADQIKVTPEEVDAFYKDNPDRFKLPEMVRASHILLGVRKDAAPEAVLEKENLANALEERLKKGEIFDDLARQYSDDPNAKQTGGDLDYFGRDRIMPEFADVAFKLKVGEISPPVRTQFGFHIIKLTDHKDPRVASLEETRGQITQYIQESKRQQAISEALTNLRQGANIDVRIP